MSLIDTIKKEGAAAALGRAVRDRLWEAGLEIDKARQSNISRKEFEKRLAAVRRLIDEAEQVDAAMRRELKS